MSLRHNGFEPGPRPGASHRQSHARDNWSHPPSSTINYNHIEIVIVTGYASITTAVTAIKRGASNYLAKPVTADDVVRALSGEEGVPIGEDDYSPMSVERVEWEHIQKVLQENDGNISATARSLGMYRRTLAKKPVQH